VTSTSSSASPRARLRRSMPWMLTVAVFVVALAVALGLRGTARLTQSVGAERACTASSLKITASSNGGLGHGAYIIEFHNVSAHRCKLAGYPRIMAPLAAATTSTLPGEITPLPSQISVVAKDEVNGYAGGINGSVRQMRRLAHRTPIISLPAHTGVASAVVEWTDESPNQATACSTIAHLLITPPGQRRQVAVPVDAFGILCSAMYVHPILPGTSGFLNLG
jgi:hypothetical protein